MSRRVAVLGGGIAGLAAAHRLAERGLAPVLFETGARLGGALATERRDGFTMELGADSILTEKPWAVALAERIGFAGRLVGTRAGERRTWVVRAGRLAPLPEGFMLMAPTDLAALARSPVFSWRGKLRMVLDLVLPRGPERPDESLADFVRRRLGQEALERVAEPLVGGIYSADPERLSLAATMPRFREIERTHRSLVLGLRATAAARGTSGARYDLFVAPADGMEALVSAIARRLPEGAVRLGAAVEGVSRASGGWRVRAGGEPFDVDALVVALPAWEASRLLAPLDAELGRLVGDLAYTSAATVNLAYRTGDVADRLRGFGFVVPAIERRALLACTFSSRKYPGRAPDGHELVRGFLGGALRPDPLALNDAEIVATVRKELADLAGIAAEPLFARVARWPRAMPQYAVGHLARVETIEARAARLPGVALAGAAYRGVGIPDCVRSGEAAADAVSDAPAPAPSETRPRN
jgi:oxygen-dependent protoporphyrinogen oxidase